MISVYVRLTLKSFFSLPIYVKKISNSSLKIVMQASQGSPVFQFLCILVNQLSKGTIQTLLRMTDIIIVFRTHAFRFHNIYILYLTNTSCIIYHYMFGCLLTVYESISGRLKVHTCTYIYKASRSRFFSVSSLRYSPA